MKKVFVFMLALCMVFALVGCGAAETSEPVQTAEATEAPLTEPTVEPTTEPTPEEPEETSLLSPVGAFLDTEVTNGDGFSRFIMVFDYTNDDTNRTLPTETTDIYLSINDANSYDIHRGSSFDEPGSLLGIDIEALSRYTGYGYALHYGNLLGGADPVRMFTIFYANPNDLKSSEKLTVTVGDQTVEYAPEDVQEISLVDEILTVETDYEKAQSLAAFKWRLDKAFVNATFTAKTRGVYGEDYSSFSESMTWLFAEGVDWGVTIADMPFSGQTEIHGIKFDEALREELPPFDLELVLTEYPEIADKINSLIENHNALAEALATKGTKDQTVEDLLNEVRNDYFDICDALGIEYSNYD